MYFWQMYLEFDQTALKSVLARSSCGGIPALFKSDLYDVEKSHVSVVAVTRIQIKI